MLITITCHYPPCSLKSFTTSSDHFHHHHHIHYYYPCKIKQNICWNHNPHQDHWYHQCPSHHHLHHDCHHPHDHPPVLVKTSIISTVITTATNPQVCKAGRLGQVSWSQGGGQSCSWPWPLPAQWLWASAPPLRTTAPGSPGTRRTSPSGSTKHPPGVPAQTAESSTLTSFTPDRAAGQHVNQKHDGINQSDQLTGESSTDNSHLSRQWDSTSIGLTS